jgi:hypothetical protein
MRLNEVQYDYIGTIAKAIQIIWLSNHSTITIKCRKLIGSYINISLLPHPFLLPDTLRSTTQYITIDFNNTQTHKENRSRNK